MFHNSLHNLLLVVVPGFQDIINTSNIAGNFPMHTVVHLIPSFALYGVNYLCLISV